MRQSFFGFDTWLSGVTKSSRPESPHHQADAEMSAWCSDQALSFGHKDLAKKVSVLWNPKMRSTAGRAKWPSCEIELNPKLKEFGEEEILRTLKHEFAHLLAYQRNKHRRIEPHGVEWRAACADLGIPNERVCHTLPFKKRTLKRNFAYGCPSCGVVIHRVRAIRRPVACLACCKTYNFGRYDKRFRLEAVAPAV